MEVPFAIKSFVQEMPRRAWAVIIRNRVLLAVVVLLVINYFAFNPIYAHFFLHTGKPTHVGELIGTPGLIL